MVIHNLNVLKGSRHSSFGDSSEIFNTSGVYVFRLETLNTEMSPIEKPSNLSDGSGQLEIRLSVKTKNRAMSFRYVCL